MNTRYWVSCLGKIALPTASHRPTKGSAVGRFSPGRGDRQRFLLCPKLKIFAMRAQAPSSPLTGILAHAFAEPSFQSRPVGVGQIEGVIT